MSAGPLILVTGVTGYVGGRLRMELEGRGHRVRCMARRPAEVGAPQASGTEIVAGDVFDEASLTSALGGVHTAYYMIHSMGSKDEFEERDRTAARNFANAARAAGVRRIVYLGGFGDASAELSRHLRSRHEVGRVLRKSGASVIEFRASVVLGSGSLSFELVRALVERPPVMITPRWVRVQAQPILITDVLRYLVAALDLPTTESEIFEIGGREVCSYADIMREYARQRGLKRWMISVPVLTPRPSSLWLGLVTPVYARVGRKLIGSLRHPTVVTNDRAARHFPDIEPIGLTDAIAGALRSEDEEFVQSRWCDAVSSGGDRSARKVARYGRRLVDARSRLVHVAPEQAFAPVRRIGGRTGWYFGTWLWRLRGFLDLLVGGVGLRRGRRDPERLRVGEPLDFWRVKAFEPDRRLLLEAEMKVPGRAWLEFRVEPENGGSRIHQIAVFDPRGLSGQIYWYALYPLHCLLFGGMLRRLAARAERSA